MHFSRAKLFVFVVLFCGFYGYVGIASAAIPVDVRHQSVAVLTASYAKEERFLESASVRDQHGVTHKRLQQTYLGYPVLGGVVMMHVPDVQYSASMKTRLNGVFYRGIKADLAATPAFVFTEEAAQKALQFALAYDQKKVKRKTDIQQTAVHLKVYVDEQQKAHWVFLTELSDVPPSGLPRKPRLLIDAVSFEVYQEWDDLMTLDASVGGGLGGNLKTGQVIYDGMAGHLPALSIQREGQRALCYLQNADVTVKDSRFKGKTVQFPCARPQAIHPALYWDGALDAVNGAYSPANDALSVGKTVKEMYESWYGIPVLSEHGQSMMLNLWVHEDVENAYWDGQEMVFGDGGSVFYPLVSLGVAAHEISHGFTEQHANLMYYGQSGALNESFSDMAAKAAEYYKYGRNTWEIGSEILKRNHSALRYMDEPTQDCALGAKPGQACSIAHINDYRAGLDVHFASGVYNKVFYLLSNSNGWNTKKAFDVMVQANTHYWTPNESFRSAACGVRDAAQDYHYDVASLLRVFEQVGIALSEC